MPQEAYSVRDEEKIAELNESGEWNIDTVKTKPSRVNSEKYKRNFKETKEEYGTGYEIFQ